MSASGQGEQSGRLSPVHIPPDLGTMSDTQFNELNQRALEAASDDRPFVGDHLESLEDLRADYEGAPVFQKQLDWLITNGFKNVIRIKGDGDCFFRAVAYSYFYQLFSLDEKELEVATRLSIHGQSDKLFQQAGFQEIVYEDIRELFCSTLSWFINPAPDDGKLISKEDLLKLFLNWDSSNSLVFYLRLLASAQIRQDPDSFAPFLINPDTAEPMEVVTFCTNVVETMGKEADDPQITALARVLQLNLDIAYVDGRGDGNSVEFVKFRHNEESQIPPIALLYRPGHYDILSV
ncbi:hypothetical protein AX16_009329 [Volvariella volvacea WC 439]|nr:hypothetical protein AX16_009329 [Volvariella volvacea WC 439]